MVEIFENSDSGVSLTSRVTNLVFKVESMVITLLKEQFHEI